MSLNVAVGVVSLTQHAIISNFPCADCDAPDPQWASINNGVFICSKCAGIHRSLGVEHSFVQSLNLDIWTPENIELFLVHGNNNPLINERLEHSVPDHILKPNPHSSSDIRETYIIQKYKHRSFSSDKGMVRNAPKKDPNEELKLTDAGSIEFIGVICVNLISAKDLIKSDIIGLSDPYCIVKIGNQILKSKVIKNNLNPHWDEKLMFSWDGKSPLIINVMDKDKFKKDGNLSFLLSFFFHHLLKLILLK